MTGGLESQESTARTSDLAATVANEWHAVLGEALRSDEERSSDFFDSGGDSVLAAQLLERIEAETGVRIHFRRFMSYPTLNALVAMVVGDTNSR